MFRRLGVAAAAIAGMVGIVGFINYWLCERALAQVIAANPRNHGVVAYAHFDHFVAPRALVFDLRNIEKSQTKLDVFRVLLEFAESQAGNDYESVKLSFRGEAKFVLKGAYFKSLGVAFRDQNPIYTLRTFPQNVYTVDGRPAFESASGNGLAAIGKQFEDFSQIHRQWYQQELAGEFR